MISHLADLRNPHSLCKVYQRNLENTASLHIVVTYFHIILFLMYNLQLLGLRPIYPQEDGVKQPQPAPELLMCIFDFI